LAPSFCGNLRHCNMSGDHWFESGLTGLLTDLYELTMGACYFEQAMEETATFSLFVRNLPENRSFLVAAGLDEALTFLESFSFSEPAIDYLRSTELFREAYLEYLSSMGFSGDVVAVPEGTVIFENEPILEVTAPLAQAQIVETFLLSALQLQTVIASKAARIVMAARNCRVVDFASRRAHGMDAALKVARASHIAGFSATSNVLAGKEYGIPVAGTVAHSFIQAFETETEAFRAFSRLFPDNSVLLIDTYNTLEGARRAVVIGQEMAREGKRLRGVRLDSGDMVHLSSEVRRILDEADLEDARIFSSGSLNEYKIDEALAAGAPIDAFGVGSHLAVSYDAPGLDIVYKLVEYGGRPVLKLSQDKQTLAGRKQVFRSYAYSDSGEMTQDMIALRDEHIAGMEPLLVPVVEQGTKLVPPRKLGDIRSYAASQLARLPRSLKTLRGRAPYSVRHSKALRKLQTQLVGQHGA
jgi:nicotinate phosphoribosyltransferase